MVRCPSATTKCSGVTTMRAVVTAFSSVERNPDSCEVRSVTEVRTRSLGAEGPDVSVVGLGTNNFGARIDYDESKAVLDEAIEQGVTLVDTADIYSQGTSEEFIGRALEGRRDAVFVATKFGKPMNGSPSESRGSPEKRASGN